MAVWDKSRDSRMFVQEPKGPLMARENNANWMRYIAQNILDKLIYIENDTNNRKARCVY